MSKISGKETKPEVLVRKFLFSRGFRYRKNVEGYPGKPDILLPKFMYITIEKYTIFQLKSIPVLIVCEDKKSYLNAG